MKYIIQCKCGWEYPIFDSKQEAEIHAESELKGMILAAKKVSDNLDVLKEKHTYQIFEVK